MSSYRPMPGIPEQRGVFVRLPPSHFKVVARKAQGFSAQQIRDDLNITEKTVASYADRAKDKLGVMSIQDVLWAFYAEYAPGMWPIVNNGDEPRA